MRQARTGRNLAPAREANVPIGALPWVGLGYCVIAVVVASAAALTTPGRSSPGATVLAYASILAFPVVGAWIASKRPSNPIGWLFLLAGFVLATGGVVQEFTERALRSGLGSAGALVRIYAIGSGGWAVGLGSVLVFPLLLFPDGHPLSPRWRIAVWVECVAIALLVVSSPFIPDATQPLAGNPFATGVRSTVAAAVSQVGAVLFILLIPLAAAALILRFRRSRGVERDQMKWFVFGGTVTVAAVLIGVVLDAFGHADARSNVIGIGIMALPISAGIAMLRYRLWDIDVVIRKAIVYAVLVALILAIAAFLLVTVGAILSIVLGPTTEEPNFLFAYGLVVGASIWPLRRVAVRLADRLVYGSRATPYEVLTAFSGRLGTTYATDDVLARMAQVLASGTGATSARVLLRVGDGQREVAIYGEPGDDEYIAPVMHEGEEIGALAMRMPANDPMTRSKEKLAEDLAAQAGPVLRNVRLIEELKASRQRLVAAQDEERRKLERNIHDGAQQQLVALAVRLRLAEQMVDRDPSQTKTLLSQLQGAAGAALEDLRDLARGIYPPLLADQGLEAALVAQARKAALPVAVEADGVGRCSQDVEATVYFCALEALNNVAKYAEASRATVRLSRSDGALRFVVEDDGVGFDVTATGYGTGLHGMADRLAALGGSLTVSSTPGAGAAVSGFLPLADVSAEG